MNILLWIIFGAIAGAIAKWIHPGNDPGGWIVTILLGIVGAVLGGWIASALGIGAVTGFNIGSMLIAIAGAVLVLAIYRAMSKRRV